MTSREQEYLKALGSRILNEANDLKRTPAALARDLGIPFEEIDAVIQGSAPLEQAKEIVFSMARTYPISLGNIWLDEDDTDQGVRVISADDSAATSRIFQRKNKDGGVSDYYEYRDTAMSRTAPFKPEWIKELRVVDNDDPENPDVTFNNGHFMHQTTFFIGPVNFYWEEDGKRRCAEMNTGDSNYITPFVPHSFTSRDPDQEALIIAVTYGDNVSNAISAFINMGAEAANEIAGNLRADNPYATRLSRQCAASMISERELACRLEDGGLEASRARDLATGMVTPNGTEIAMVAADLSISPQDLMATSMAPGEDVVVTFRTDSIERGYPDDNAPAYRLRELARSPHQPYLKGFEVTVCGDTNGNMRHGLHEYIYNHGAHPVDLVWGDGRRTTLRSGDSAYVQPMVTHRFEPHEDGKEATLAMIRIPGKLTDITLDEYAKFEPSNRQRVAGETKTWF